MLHVGLDEACRHARDTRPCIEKDEYAIKSAACATIENYVLLRTSRQHGSKQTFRATSKYAVVFKTDDGELRVCFQHHNIEKFILKNER